MALLLKSKIDKLNRLKQFYLQNKFSKKYSFSYYKEGFEKLFLNK
tara:strand:+ start:928 stop:1062 length:135 start_codon:yes stop_codon:yes gene_type:complete